MPNLRRRLLLDSPQYNKSEFEFGFDKVPSEVSGDKSYVHSIKGNSLVWNQLIAISNSSLSKTENGVTFTDNRDGSYTVVTDSIGATAQTYLQIATSPNFIIGHKYLGIGCPNGGSLSTFYLRDRQLSTNTFLDTGNGSISILTLSIGIRSAIYIEENTIISSPITFRPQYIDLTLLGIDNLTTVEEVEAWLADNVGTRDYYDYNPGTILNNKTEQVEVVGFNQWDEEWKAGTYDSLTGLKLDTSPWADGKIRNSNFIPVFPSTTYYVGNSSFMYWEYDENKNYLTPGRNTGFTPTNGLFTTTASTHYINFRAQANTYNYDICINISDPAKNGVYEPYRKTTIPLNLTSLKGKLLDSQGQPTGSSVVISPNGLAGKNDWRDYCIIEGGYITKIVKKTVEIDMGQLDYTVSTFGGYNRTSTSELPTLAKTTTNFVLGHSINTYGFIPADAPLGVSNHINLGMAYYNKMLYIRNDAWVGKTNTQVKEEMTGTTLLYESATPQTYLLDTPIPLTNRVDNGGTKRRLPEDTASAVSAPFSCEVAYDTINTNTNSIERVNATEEFIYDNISIDKPVKRGILTKIKGKSLVWNQLVQIPSSDASITRNGVTITDNRDGSFTVQTDANGATDIVTLSLFNLATNYTAKHSFFVRGCPSGGSANTFHLRDVYWGQVIDTGDGAIYSPSLNNGVQKFNLAIRIQSGAIITTPITFSPIVTDLTQMFGAGNEPTTVAEFEKLFPLPYYNYNAGEIISNKTESVKLVGFNQLDLTNKQVDKVMNQYGAITSYNGYTVTDFIRVLPNTAYYFHKVAQWNVTRCVCWYRADNSFISAASLAPVTSGALYSSGELTSPAGAYSMRVCYYSAYDNEVCVNLSDVNRNGQYEPYWKNTVNLNITSLTGKLNGEGNSVTIVPTGLKSAGTVYDYGIIEKGKLTKIVKCIGEVDLGTLTYAYYQGSVGGGTAHPYFITPLSGKYGNDVAALCSKYETVNWVAFARSTDKVLNTANAIGSNYIQIRDSAYTDTATFKTAMSGVMLNYELATPEVYILDNPVPVSLLTYKDCTVKQLPENTSTVITAPNVEVIKNQIH